MGVGRNWELTVSEMRVYSRIMNGMTNGEIAKDLWITVKAVEYHATNIYRKLGVSGRAALIFTAAPLELRAMREYIEGLEQRIEALEAMIPSTASELSS